MGATPSNHRSIDSKWLRPLEYVLFGTAAIYGFFALLLLLAPAVGIAGGVGGLALVTGVGMLVLVPVGFVAAVVVAIAVHKDGERVRAADLEWTPSAVLYPILGFVFSGLAAVDYLYKRHEYTASSPASSSWWYGVVGLLALVAIGTAIAAVAPSVGGELSTVLAAGLPICLYKDCGYVRSVADGWQPNPVTYFAGAWVALLAVFLFPLIGLSMYLVLVGIYASKRRTAGVL
ncbi:hypothetical protein [Halopiger thermotolerans]